MNPGHESFFTHVGKYMDDEETKERARRVFADPEFRAETARLRAEALAARRKREAAEVDFDSSEDDS